jgi:hypothetical protein
VAGTASSLRTRFIAFDLDDALLVRGGAWRYTVEEAVASVTGRRVDAAALAPEYLRRPWRHALEVVMERGEDVDAACALCDAMFQRSAMKRLLVHDGLGMALDRLRGARIEMGAITRAPHDLAIRQVESTGLDRFLTVLSPTPPGERWDPWARVQQCLGYVDREAAVAAFVSAEPFDLRACAPGGVGCYEAGWAMGETAGFTRLASTGDLDAFLGRNR